MDLPHIIGDVLIGDVEFVNPFLANDGEGEHHRGPHQLRHIKFRFAPDQTFTRRNLAQFAAGIKNHKRLESVAFEGCNFVELGNDPDNYEDFDPSINADGVMYDMDVELMFTMLGGHPSIREYIFLDSKIDDRFLFMFLWSIPSPRPGFPAPTPPLTSLQLVEVAMERDGYVAINRMLEREVRLEYLQVINRTSMDEEGCRLICEGVASNGHLRELQLYGGFAIQPETLLGAVSRKSPLTKLFVVTNSWASEDAYSRLVHSLRSNTRIKSLQVLTWNDCPPDSGQMAELLLLYNKTLRLVEFGKIGLPATVQYGLRPPKPISLYGLGLYGRSSGLVGAGEATGHGVSSYIHFRDVTRRLFHETSENDDDDVDNDGRMELDQA